jgi:hypothetical protein
VTRYRDEVEEDGRWTRVYYPVMRDRQPYKLCCCDCGLVHDIEFWVEEDRVAMRVARNRRATGQIRRHMKREALRAGGGERGA